MAAKRISRAKQREIERAIKAGETQFSIAARLKIGKSTVARHSMRLIAAGVLPSKRQEYLERGARMEAEIRRLLLEGKSVRWVRLNVPGAGNVHNVKRRMIAAGEIEGGARPDPFSAEQESRIARLLRKGLSIYRVQQIVGCDWRAIRKRAVRMGFKIGARGPITAAGDPILRAIEQALPPRCEQWVREEATSELWIEVRTRQTAIADLAERAKKVISSIYGRYDCFDQWRFLSLDERRGEDGGYSLADVLTCPRSLQYLEECGV